MISILILLTPPSLEAITIGRDLLIRYLKPFSFRLNSKGWLLLILLHSLEDGLLEG